MCKSPTGVLTIYGDEFGVARSVSGFQTRDSAFRAERKDGCDGSIAVVTERAGELHNDFWPPRTRRPARFSLRSGRWDQWGRGPGCQDSRSNFDRRLIRATPVTDTPKN